MSAHNVLHNMYKAPFSLPDPGDAGTLNVDRWHAHFPIVTAGASETRILAAPTKAGLTCVVEHDTDGGDFTLTVNPTSGTCYGYDQSNNTTIAYAEAGDWVAFGSVKIGSEYVWRVLRSEGVDVAQTITTLTTTTLTIGSTVLAAGDMTPGTGISTGTGTVCEHRVTKVGGLYKTEILLDVTGLNDGDTAGDVIGKDGDTANCHIGQITAAVNGTIIAGRVHCLEVPAGGDVDIDIWGSVDEATLAQDTAISAATGEEQLIDHGDWAANEIDELSALPDADGYLYLATGAQGTDQDYTAGIFLIELWGI